MRPNLLTHQASNSSTTTVHHFGGAMHVDTSVNFFSHTTPAKLFEIKGQTTFLVNKCSKLFRFSFADPAYDLLDQYRDPQRKEKVQILFGPPKMEPT